jgi:hypothetical protein
MEHRVPISNWIQYGGTIIFPACFSRIGMARESAGVSHRDHTFQPVMMYEREEYIPDTTATGLMLVDHQ